MALIGHVSLVGAGPGDPGLLTRRAIARLRAADLVLYDALVDTRVLKYARKAQRFFVGKRAGRHAMTQDAIHRLMIREARKGKRIVRLKGGDPFVFGRGGEEALALQHAGVRYDVVPGVSSAIAAPAAAGIPVTHRGVASAFFVVSAHEEAAFASAIEGLRPDRATLVVLMGLARSAAIAWRLLDARWSRRTPVAVIIDASTDDQQQWRGTLDDLAEGQFVPPAGCAGTIVVGDVVSIGIHRQHTDVRGRRGARALASGTGDPRGEDHVSDGRSEDLRPNAAVVRRHARRR
jgi:uroporphyrin-III C-methyltransferase / precorrin-2 dehydrogenase / sirohydrochlorin ferrochelatase